MGLKGHTPKKLFGVSYFITNFVMNVRIIVGSWNYGLEKLYSQILIWKQFKLYSHMIINFGRE
jgi:hypothetical protein